MDWPIVGALFRRYLRMSRECFTPLGICVLRESFPYHDRRRPIYSGPPAGRLFRLKTADNSRRESAGHQKSSRRCWFSRKGSRSEHLKAAENSEQSPAFSSLLIKLSPTAGRIYASDPEDLGGFPTGYHAYDRTTWIAGIFLNSKFCEDRLPSQNARG